MVATVDLCRNGHDKTNNVYVRGGCKTCAKNRAHKQRQETPLEVRNAYQREWVRKNPDKRRTIMRRYYKANTKKHRAGVVRWQAANKDHYRDQQREYMRRWREQNPGYFSQASRKRDALKRSSMVAPFTMSQLTARMSYWGNRCWLCPDGTFETVDHVKPLAKGGPHMLANLRPACKSCNSSKNDRWPL